MLLKMRNNIIQGRKMSMKNVFTGIDSGEDIAIEAVASKKEQGGRMTRIRTRTLQLRGRLRICMR